MKTICVSFRRLHSVCIHQGGIWWNGVKICQNPLNRDPVLAATWSVCSARRCPVVRKAK